MRSNKLLKNLFILSFLIVLIVSSCQTPGSSSGGGGDDDGVVKELANGVYAKLIIARITTNISGTFYKMDSLEAVFSKYYDPCASKSDMYPTGVSCSDTAGTNYILALKNNVYLYNDPLDINGFLNLGLLHTFDVDGSIEVPDLIASIDLPATEPTVTFPANNAIIPKSNDLEVRWQGNTGGNVSIVLFSVANSSQRVSAETSDDGSYTFTAAQLSSLSNGQYYLHIERFNEDFIVDDLDGYDDRSIIRARLIYSMFINLTD